MSIFYSSSGPWKSKVVLDNLISVQVDKLILKMFKRFFFTLYNGIISKKLISEINVN